MKYKIELAKTKEQLDKLYDNSALTIEGLAEESIPDFWNWIEENTKEFNEKLKIAGHELSEEATVYIIKGKLMNEVYGLTGDNIYPDDLTIISVLDINIGPLIMKRFEIGGRWFDDIVENNRMR